MTACKNFGTTWLTGKFLGLQATLEGTPIIQWGYMEMKGKSQKVVTKLQS